MVSIEENSSDDFAAARDRLSGAMSLDALREAASAAWNTPPASNFAPAAYGLEEPAVAFLRDMDDAPAQPAGGGATLSLVANNDEGVITPSDAKAIANEVTQLCMAAGVPPAEIAILVARIEGSVGGSRAMLDGIRSAAMNDAQSLASNAADKAAESAEARRERLWNEIEALDNKIEDASKTLDPYKTEEERKAERDAQVEYDAAKAEAERLRREGAPEAEVQAADAHAAAKGEVLGDLQTKSANRIADNPATPPAVADTARVLVVDVGRRDAGYAALQRGQSTQGEEQVIGENPRSNMQMGATFQPMTVENPRGDVQIGTALQQMIEENPRGDIQVSTALRVDAVRTPRADLSDADLGIEPVAEIIRQQATVPLPVQPMAVADVGNEQSALLESPATNLALVRNGQAVVVS